VQDDFDQQLADAEEAINTAQNLARSQEQQVARMQKEGLNTRDAEALLAAYRLGVQLAVQRKASLEAALRPRPKFLRRKQ
jgi:hypothetical protein